MQWVCVLETRKKLFITINITTIARRVEDNVQRRHNGDETMGTAQPAGRIQRCRCQVDARMCVGVEGSQGGGAWREKWGSKNGQTHRAIGVTVFFDNAMHNR
jgi:hypothetical protein